MSDFISREDALKMLCNRCNSTCNLDGNCDEMDAINDIPSADVVPVVRCKNCKHYMTIHCVCDGCCISDDWFCASGKRKEEKDE